MMHTMLEWLEQIDNILTFEFLFFAAAIIVLYYSTPLKCRWIVLWAGSVAFVAAAGWHATAYLTAVALLCWLGGIALGKLTSEWEKKVLLVALLTVDIGAMLMFKILPVFADMGFMIPIGLSYYTFQSAGYLIDVYCERAPMQKNPLRMWLFLGYFPQLTQGPISQWHELGPQLNNGRRLEPINIAAGFQMLLWGLFKKLVVADRLASVSAAWAAGDASMPGWMAFGAVLMATFRLYADFSGGTDVVRGISRMLGIMLPVNFRRPFLAVSLGDYWRRWHITLGTWFKTYLMYPLTTSRFCIALGRSASRVLGKKSGKLLPTALATLIVFVLIGVWHDLEWNALIFGAYFGVLMSVSVLLDPLWKYLRRKLHLPKNGWMRPIRILRTLALVLIAQYFAFVRESSQSILLLSRTFSAWDLSGFSARMTEAMSWLEWGILGGGVLIMLIVDILGEIKDDLGEKLAAGPVWLRWPVLLFLLLAVMIFGIYGPELDSTAFLYTQF